MIAIPYTLTLDQPLLATDLGNDPNSSRSHPYIPGGMLRGLLAGRLLARHAPADASGDAVFRRLILDNSVRVLHAYPVIPTDTGIIRRALPTLRSLVQPKHGTPTRYDAAHADFDRTQLEHELGNLRSVGAAFTGDVTRLDPQMHVALHIERDRVMGRSLPPKGGQRRGELFRYEALAAGQMFAGALLVDTEADAVLVRELFADTQLSLGRSRSAGYGAARIALGDNDTGWSEHEAVCNVVDRGQIIRLVFLSDALLETLEGTPVVSLDSATLATLLGVKQLVVDTTRSFVETTVIGGFNRTWQLPLSQVPAIAAGSIVTLTIPSGLDAARVAQLHRYGLGERRNEGYGRVALLREPDELVFETFPANPARNAVPVFNGLAHDMAMRFVQRRATVVIDTRIAAYARNSGISPNATISAAQLGGLSALARQAQLDPAGIRDLTQHLGNLPRRAHDQFEHARMRNEQQSLFDWLNELLKTPGLVWDRLQYDNHAQRIQLANSTYNPREYAVLTNTTALRLIVAVLAEARSASKLTQQENQS